MSYSPAYMQPSSLMEGQESSQLYSSAMQLTSYASNIMGHTMNQYAAQSSLLSSQVRQRVWPPLDVRLVRLTEYFQISPVNNNISKANFAGAGNPPTPPPPAVTISAQSQMGSSSFSQTPAAPIGHTSTSFTPPTSFPRQQFPSSAAMYGWY